MELPRDKTEVTFVFGDTHGIYMDKKWWSIVKNIIYDLKPDRIVMNGDVVDFYAISRFDKDPNRRESLQDEIDITKQFLDSVRFWSKDAEIIWVEGNHEARLQKYLWSKSPELASLDMLDIENIFETDKRGIKYIKSRGREAYYQMGKIKIGHFNKVSQESAYTAKALVTRYACTIIQNHVHRLGKYYKTYGNDVVVGIEAGCGCMLNPEYTCDPNWQQGFVIITKLKNDNRYYIEDVPIIKHETLFRNALYKA